MLKILVLSVKNFSVKNFSVKNFSFKNFSVKNFSVKKLSPIFYVDLCRGINSTINTGAIFIVANQ